MAFSADLSKYRGKGYESSSLAEILTAPVSALAGVSGDDALALQTSFRIMTDGDLGKNKYLAAAQAMLALTK